MSDLRAMGTQSQRPALAVFRSGAAVGVAVGAIAVGGSGVVSAEAAAAAAAGTLLAVAALGVGPLLMAVTRRASPPAVMAVALAGYAVTVLALAVVYLAWGAVPSLPGEHVGYGILAAAVGSSAGQVQAVRRLRVLAFGDGGHRGWGHSTDRLTRDGR